MKSTSPNHPSVWLSVYFLSLLLVATPFVDLLAQVGKLQPGELVWRYGFLGFLSNNLLTPLLGVTLAAVAAATLGHRRTLNGLAGTSVLVALGLIGLMAIFSLDVVQVEDGVNPVARAAFRVGATIAVVKFLFSSAGFGLIAWTTRRSALAIAVPTRRVVVPVPAPLVGAVPAQNGKRKPMSPATGRSVEA